MRQFITQFFLCQFADAQSNHRARGIPGGRVNLSRKTMENINALQIIVLEKTNQEWLSLQWKRKKSHSFHLGGGS